MQSHSDHESKSAYTKFWISLGVNAVLMFVLMFVMVNTFADFILNINFFYMAIVMAAPMGIIMLASMPMTYPDKRKNAICYAALAVAFVASFASIRTQAFVSDTGFLQSMIPHHSGAILMCRNAKLSDPRVVTLCQSIEKSQQQEIDAMNAILKSRAQGHR